jgi:hypothetical protein
VGATTLYAVEAWWPGLERTRLGRRSRTGGKGVAAVVNKALTAAARAAVPAWKTTPTEEVLATCRLPPAEVVAGRRRARFRARVKADPGHVVHSRILARAQTRLTDDTLVEAPREVRPP